jgi:hypothetical protein
MWPEADKRIPLLRIEQQRFGYNKNGISWLTEELINSNKKCPVELVN